MNQLKLEIISIDGILFSDNCNMAVVPCSLGEIGFMYGHEELVATLKHGNINIYDNNENIMQSFEVNSEGFVKMQNPDKLMILLK